LIFNSFSSGGIVMFLKKSIFSLFILITSFGLSAESSSLSGDDIISALVKGTLTVSDIQGSQIYSITDNKERNLLSLALMNRRGESLIPMLFSKVLTERTPKSMPAIYSFLSFADKDGKTPLFYAAENKRINLVELLNNELSNKGISAPKIWKKNDTEFQLNIKKALLRAIQLSNNEFAMSLIKAADVDLLSPVQVEREYKNKDKIIVETENRYAILMAADNKNWEMVKEILIKAPKSIKITGSEGFTAFMAVVSDNKNLQKNISDVCSGKSINLVDLFILKACPDFQTVVCSQADPEPNKRCGYIYITDKEGYDACFYASRKTKKYLIEKYGQKYCDFSERRKAIKAQEENK
jgi:ankyrin repeat protein